MYKLHKDRIIVSIFIAILFILLLILAPHEVVVDSGTVPAHAQIAGVPNVVEPSTVVRPE